MKLLAVDDNPQILEVLPAIFRQASLLQITLANSAANALALLNDPEQHFDVLLLDINMPQMDGIDLCRHIRLMPQYRTAPILMLTSAADRDHIERAFAAGADDYVTKPFDVKDIVTRVRVAERMAARAPRAKSLDPNYRYLDVPEGVHPMRLADPVRIAKVDQLILPFSLGNYLSQLSRRRLDGCHIFSVRLLDVGMLYASAKTHEFALGLKQVVQAVTQVVHCPRLLMAYQGEGTFICITQCEEAPAWPEVEERVQDMLNKSAQTLENGWPMGLIVAIGNPITPNASSNQRVKKTFDRAVERALHREKAKSRQAFQIRQMAYQNSIERHVS
ncbi:MAG: response regulator [Pseudomonadota bacterium]